jgi:hypothetical protein
MCTYSVTYFFTLSSNGPVRRGEMLYRRRTSHSWSLLLKQFQIGHASRTATSLRHLKISRPSASHFWFVNRRRPSSPYLYQPSLAVDTAGDVGECDLLAHSCCGAALLDLSHNGQVSNRAGTSILQSLARLEGNSKHKI